MMKWIIPLILIFFVACSSQNVTLEDGIFSVTTDDGYDLVGDIRLGESVDSSEAVILVHSLHNNRQEWSSAYRDGLARNYTTVRFDLRGHGDSTGDKDSFTEEDYRAMTQDIGAVVSYLKKQGVTTFYIIGSDLGANLALQYAAIDSSVKRLILISPTENTKGVTTRDVLDVYTGELYIFMSREYQIDWDYGLYMKDNFNGEKKLRLVDGGGHGAESFLQNRLDDTIQFTLHFLQR